MSGNGIQRDAPARNTFSEIRIFDTRGQAVFTQQTESAEQVEFNVNDLQNGLYLLSIDGNRYKLIIAR